MSAFCVSLCMLVTSAVWAESSTPIPQFPQNFPKANKKLGRLQPTIQNIGADYCKQVQFAPDILPKIANPKYQKMLSQEINVANVLCKNGVYVGFPQTPADENLKFLTDIEILRLVTFKIFALYKEVPGAGTIIYQSVSRLQDFELLISSDIAEAYNYPGSEGKSPPIAGIAEWVWRLHELYGNKQL